MSEYIPNKFTLNHIPSMEKYADSLAEYFSNSFGYNLFGQIVDVQANRPQDLVANTEFAGGLMRVASLRLSLPGMIVLKESEIPAVQEQFAFVAAAHGWKTAHIDYQFFYSKMCRLTNIWLYHNYNENKQRYFVSCFKCTLN